MLTPPVPFRSIGTFAASHASAWQPIWQAIPALPALRHLELGGNAFGDVALEGLRAALQEATQLHTIGLGHPAVAVPLCLAGLRSLSHAAATSGGPEEDANDGGGGGGDGDRRVHLDLSHAQLTASDACIIADALEALRLELPTKLAVSGSQASTGSELPPDYSLTSIDLSHNLLTLPSVVVDDDSAGGGSVQQMLAHQLGAPAERLGQIEHIASLLATASQLPSLTSLSLAKNSLGAGDTLSIAPAILGAVLRVGAVDLSGNAGADEGGEVREALALLTAGLQGLSWCKVMHHRMGSESCARLLPPDLVQTIADLVTPTPILVDMLFFGQPFVGVKERAPLSQQELDEGDEFFDECDGWMAASASVSARQYPFAPLAGGVPNFALPAQTVGQFWAEDDAEADEAFDQFLRETGQA